MANPQRGEVEIEIDGRACRLCLTLGGLAEIEALMATGEPLDGRRLIAVLAVLLRGGGHEITKDRLAGSDIDVQRAVEAVTRCFEAAA